MVRILLHQAAQPPVVFVLARVFLEVQDHPGAPRRSGDGLHGELGLSVTAPAHALVRGQVGAPALHDQAIGDQESGVEADAELADEAGLLSLIPAQRVQEFGGAGARDGAQIGDRLVPRHADPVVGDGDDMRLGVDFDAHPQFGIFRQQVGIAQRGEAQLVGGVGGVGDQLAQEDVAVAVHRVNHQPQQPLGFGLKPQGLGLGGLGHEPLRAGVDDWA